MAGSTLYNTTDGPLLIDRAGRVLGARERLEDADPSSSPIAGHITAGRIVVVAEPPGDSDAEQHTDDQPQPVKGKAGRRTPAPSTEEA